MTPAGRVRAGLGVPVGGAADRFALALGNALVGNPPDTAALEISLAGPTLQADATLACVLFGAPFAMSSDRQELTAGTTFTLQSSERDAHRRHGAGDAPTSAWPAASMRR